MAERVNVFATIGKTVLSFSGAKWFYGDSDIRSKTGIKLLTERTLDDGDALISGDQAKRKLVRLTAKLAKDGIVGNAAQSENTRSYDFYCDPEFAEEAMKGLAGKNVDANLLPGSWKIIDVYRKLVITRK